MSNYENLVAARATARASLPGYGFFDILLLPPRCGTTGHVYGGLTMMHREERLQTMARTYTGLQLCCAARRFGGLCLALMLTMAFLLFLPRSALASSASSLTLAANATRATGGPMLQVNAGFDGRYRNGDWVPIHITLRNNGADFSGTLSTSHPLGQIMQAAGFTAVPVSTYQRP